MIRTDMMILRSLVGYLSSLVATYAASPFETVYSTIRQTLKVGLERRHQSARIPSAFQSAIVQDYVL